jgi:hypothetical protein
MAKGLGNRSGRTTPAQARKAAKNRQREGVVFLQTPGGRCEMWWDRRLVEYDVAYDPDSLLDALRRRRVPASVPIQVETMEGHRTPWTYR